jgi:hypothetical protein
VGRGNWRLHRWVGTPSGKIRNQLQGYKHTSLAFLVVKSRKFSQENGFASNSEPSSISAKEGSSMPSTAKPADMLR